MARKVKAVVNQLNSWDEVDNCLHKICECEIAIDTLETTMQMEFNDSRKKAKKLQAPLITAIEVLESQIQDFVEDNRTDLVGKSKDLNFGLVGFRQSTSVSYSTKKTEQIIENLKKYNMMNCILVGKETVNKQALKLYAEKDIIKIGAKLKTEDKFFCEVDREKLKG